MKRTLLAEGRREEIVARTLLAFIALLALASAPRALAEVRVEIPVRGVNLHSAMGPEMNAVPAMHFNWVRMDVFWSDVETADGIFFWDDIDRQVQSHVSRGLRIYANLTSTPAWACRAGGLPSAGSCVPREGLFGRFAGAVATRYRGAILVYGIWNEPDQPAFWQGDAFIYVDALLIPAAAAIRQADPSARIAAPELSGSHGLSVRPPDTFFNAIGLRGVADSVDIVSQHVYEDSGFSGPDGIVRKFFDGDFFHHSLLYFIDHSVLNQKEIWITEFGFAGGGDAGNGTYVLRTFELFGPRERVTGLFNYELADCGTCVPLGTTGLLRGDLSWKIGAQQLAALLGDTEPPAPPFRDRFSRPWSAILHRWVLPDGGGSVRDGHLSNTVPDFRAKIEDLVVTDFEISSTVKLTDDLGRPTSWVGLVGRTRAVSDGGLDSGYLAVLRSDGVVALSSPARKVDLTVWTGRNPKVAPVRLTLSAVADRIAVSIDGLEVLVARDSTFTEGYVGLQNHGFGQHDDVVVYTSRDQKGPAYESVPAGHPSVPVRR